MNIKENKNQEPFKTDIKFCSFVSINHLSQKDVFLTHLKIIKIQKIYKI